MKPFIKCILLIIAYTFTIQRGNSQIVKFIKNEVTAKYRVFITNDKNEATHIIYKVANPSDIRKPGDWYVVTNPMLFKNAVTLFEVKKKDDADFIVYYITNRDSATIKLRK